MRTFVIGFVLAFLSTIASAGCYIGGGSVESYTARVPTGKLNELLGSSYLDGSYTTDHTGRLKEALFGCVLPYDTAVEVGYAEGSFAGVDANARVVHPDTDLSVPFTLSQQVSVRLATVSVLKYINVYGPVAGFVRLGVAKTKAEAVSSIPLGDGYSFQHLETKEATSPYVGIGAAWRNKGGLNLRIERRMFAQGVYMTSVTATYPF